MTDSSIRSPDLQHTIGPLLPSLRAAAVSLQPSESVLPLLTPILRQRVQLLSFSSTNDPWIRLLCYDTSSVPRLIGIAQGELLEPHPASGELEIDWDDVETRFRRLDEETLQALVVLKTLELAFRLVYCTIEGEEAAWKVGEVIVVDSSSPFSSFGGVSTIAEAEKKFHELKEPITVAVPTADVLLKAQNSQTMDFEDDDDDDDGYWARYDATPGAKTPDMRKAPEVTKGFNASDENDYYAQYDDVQPAMDNHDPDEEANLDISPPLGLGSKVVDAESNEHYYGEMTQNDTALQPGIDHDASIVHPCPRSASSASSHRSVEKLEAAAARQEQNDFGVKQFISRNIKSMFLLSRASGIDREEFERIVKTELDTLGLLED